MKAKNIKTTALALVLAGTMALNGCSFIGSKTENESKEISMITCLVQDGKSSLDKHIGDSYISVDYKDGKLDLYYSNKIEDNYWSDKFTFNVQDDKIAQTIIDEFIASYTSSVEFDYAKFQEYLDNKYTSSTVDGNWFNEYAKLVDGQLVKNREEWITTYDENGDVFKKEIKTYVNDRLTHENYYKVIDDNNYVTTIFEINEDGKGTRLTSKFHDEHDEFGRTICLTEEMFRDAMYLGAYQTETEYNDSDSTILRKISKYDRDDKLIFKRDTLFDYQGVISYVLYTVDNDGNVVSSEVVNEEDLTEELKTNYSK